MEPKNQVACKAHKSAVQPLKTSLKLPDDSIMKLAMTITNNASQS